MTETDALLTCPLCPHHCRLAPGQTGFCRARSNRDGRILPDNYGFLTSLALDPIEKKPLRRFHPGSQILSLGSWGCSLRCPFCQNASIAQAGPETARLRLDPEQLLALALEYREKAGSIGVAFTYNEPLVGYEYVRDCARLLKEHGLATVLVTNGFLCRKPWEALLPLVDAANIDLKGFTEEFYWKVTGTHLADVLETIDYAVNEARTPEGEHVWVELTTLLIPGFNDDDAQLHAECTWIREHLGPDVPLHFSAFHPQLPHDGRTAHPARDSDPRPRHRPRRGTQLCVHRQRA